MDQKAIKTDPFGHPIEIGTKVRFFAKGYRFTTIEATVVKMTDKTLELEHEHFNIPGYRTTTKQGYTQVFVDTTGWKKPA